MTDDSLSIGEALYRIHVKSTLQVTAQQRELLARSESLAKLLQAQVGEMQEIKNAEAARSNEFSKLISEMRDVSLSKELQEAIGEHLKADIWAELTAFVAEERFESAKLQREIAKTSGLEIARAIDELRDAARGIPPLPILVADAPLFARLRAYPELVLIRAERLLLEAQPLLVGLIFLLMAVLVHFQYSR